MASRPRSSPVRVALQVDDTDDLLSHTDTPSRRFAWPQIPRSRLRASRPWMATCASHVCWLGEKKKKKRRQNKKNLANPPPWPFSPFLRSGQQGRALQRLLVHRAPHHNHDVKAGPGNAHFSRFYFHPSFLPSLSGWRMSIDLFFLIFFFFFLSQWPESKRTWETLQAVSRMPRTPPRSCARTWEQREAICPR